MQYNKYWVHSDNLDVRNVEIYPVPYGHTGDISATKYTEICQIMESSPVDESSSTQSSCELQWP